MQNIVKTDEKAPDGRTRIVFCPVVGLAQGLLLAWLTQGETGPLLARYPVWLTPVFILAVLLPQALYYSQVANPRRRRWILCAVAVASITIGVYQGATFSVGSWSEQYFVLSMTLSLLLFIGVPALSVQVDQRTARYRQWVDAALQAFGLLVQGGLILGLGWIALAATMALFSLLGMSWVADLICGAWFAFPFSCLIFALVAAKAGRDDSMTQHLFTRCMRLCGWLYPAMAVIGLIFVASWVKGIDALLETGEAASILLWFLALLVFFFNLHTRCGLEDGKAKWLRVLAVMSWITALPMLGVALYGLGLRIEQRGLSPDRIWGLLTVCIIAVFVLGYCAHAVAGFFRHGDAGRVGDAGRIVFKTHLVATLALVVSVLLMLSGIADPRRISVQSQWRQWAQQRISDDEFKRFLKYESGVFGEDALRELAERAKDPNNPVAQRAQALLDSQGYERTSVNVLRAMKVFPSGEAPPSGLIEAWSSYGTPETCRASSDEEPVCLIWKFRFGKEEAESYILLTKRGGSPYDRTAMIWQEVRPGDWEVVADFLDSECTNALEALFAAVLEGSVRIAPPARKYGDILAGNVRITSSPHDRARRECDLATP